MKKYLMILAATLFATAVFAAPSESQSIRVGIFDFPPMNFMDATGEAQGLNPDLLREIVLQKPEWNLEFIPLNWAECLSQLQTEEIDLMVSVAYTDERAQSMDYNSCPVLEVWGQVFAPLHQHHIETISDLEQKKVGLMRRDRSGENFKTLAETFGVSCQFVEYDTHTDVFAAIMAGEIHAGVVAQHYGVRHAEAYHLEGTPIQFSPFSLYFAAKKGHHQKLLAQIDARLISWKNNSKSYYFKQRDYWLNGTRNWMANVPLWAWISATVIATIALLFMGMSGFLKNQVEKRTAILKSSELYQSLSADILDIINRHTDLKGTLEAILLAIQKQTGVDAVGIRISDNEDFPYFVQNGFSKDFLLTENSIVGRDPENGICHNTDGSVCLECTCGLVISGKTDPDNPIFTPGGSCLLNDSFSLLELPESDDPRTAPRNNCIHEGYASVALIPLRTPDTIVGLLQLNGHKKNLFTLSAIKELEGIASHISGVLLRKQAGDTLKRLEAMQAKMVANIGDVIVIIDQNGINRYKSPNIEKWFGWKPEEVVGSDTLNNIHPDDRDTARKLIARLMESPNATGTFECRYRCKDGSYKWIEITGVNLLHDPDICGILGNYQDITERKKADQTLRESESRYDQLAEQGRTVAWEVDANGLYTYFSHVVTAVLDYRPDELVGKKHFYDLHPEDGREPFKDAAFKVFERKESIQGLENPVVTKDGTILWMLTTGFPVLDEQGELLGYRGSDTDITDRKQAEALLRESEEMMRNSQAVAHICSYSTNLDRSEIAKSVWTCSREFYKIFGIDEAYPHTIDGWANLIHPDFRKEMFDYHESVVKEKKLFSYEYKIIRFNDGAERWVHGTGKLEFDEKGTPIRMHGAIQDITERKTAEEHFQQAQKMDSIGQLTGGIAHDFNNKLQVILGHADLALMKASPEDRLRRDLLEIQKAGRQSSDLTRQLLAFARKETIAPLNLDLNAVTENLLSMLRRLIGENIELVWSPGIDLWAIYMDPSQIDQILTNLCVNARDAIGGAGKIKITTANTTLDQVPSAETCPAGDYVKLSCSDTGCGMDRETLTKIFEPFFTTKDRGEGTGLGLSTLYGIAQQNKGFITVDSTPGKGTTFKVHLPRCVENEINDGRVTETKQPERGQETVLLVEDEAVLLDVGTQMLEGLGYSVISTSLPEEALRIAEESTEPIDLLLTDVIMPGMNGHDLAIKLKELIPALQCLFMSGYPDEMIAHNNVLTEDTQFIQKPFSIPVIAAKLRDVLDG